MKIVKYRNSMNSNRVELGWLVKHNPCGMSRIAAEEDQEIEHCIHLMDSEFEIVAGIGCDDLLIRLAASHCVLSHAEYNRNEKYSDRHFSSVIESEVVAYLGDEQDKKLFDEINNIEKNTDSDGLFKMESEAGRK